jgi:hypothetical protein
MIRSFPSLPIGNDLIISLKRFQIQHILAGRGNPTTNHQKTDNSNFHMHVWCPSIAIYLLDCRKKSHNRVLKVALVLVPAKPTQ